MGRPATGTVEWRGNPRRPFARITIGIDPITREPVRKWIDLERPDLREDSPADVAVAKRLALKLAKLAKKKKLHIGGGSNAPAGATPACLQDDWFNHIDAVPSLSDGTRAHLKADFRCQFSADLGHIPLAHFYAERGTPILCRWVQGLSTKVSRKTGKPLGKGYVDHVVMAATRFFDDARAKGWSPPGPNPMRGEDVRRTIREFWGGKAAVTPEQDEITFLATKAAEQLLASIVEKPMPDIHPEFWRGKTLLGITGGERDAELHGATFEHARIGAREDAAFPCLKIRQQVIQASQGKPARVARDRHGRPTLKTRSSKRDIPLHPVAVAWLSWWEDEGWEAYVGRKPTPSDFLFPDPKGKPWRPESAEIFRQLLRNAGLSDKFVTPDGLAIDFEWKSTRSTFTRWLQDAEVDGEVIDALLGHAPRTMRGKHYAAPSLERKAKAVATIVLAVQLPLSRKGRAA